MSENGADEFDEPPMPDVTWDIRREGRRWNDGVTLLALLLENVGVDRAVRLGDPNVWRSAIGELR